MVGEKGGDVFIYVNSVNVCNMNPFSFILFVVKHFVFKCAKHKMYLTTLWRLAIFLLLFFSTHLIPPPLIQTNLRAKTELLAVVTQCNYHFSTSHL